MTRKDLPRDESRIASPKRRTRDDQLRERSRRADDLLRKRADLALKLFHPVARKLGPVAFRVAERPRADVGNPHVGLAAVTIEGAQHRVVGRLAADEPLRRVGVACALDPNYPEAGPGEENDLARLGIVPAPDVAEPRFPSGDIPFGS